MTKTFNKPSIYAYSWSKCVFHVLDFDSPTKHDKKPNQPIVISAFSNDGQFQFVLRVANFGMKIFVYKASNLACSYQELGSKIFKYTNTFTKFSEAIVYMHCYANGGLSEKAKKIISQPAIDYFEFKGWPGELHQKQRSIVPLGESNLLPARLPTTYD